MKKLLSSLGPVCAVIGAQWGDEGKGKIVDLLAEHYDVVARACGGANAGHTIVVGGKKHVFHLLPSGCLHESAQVVLGAGMVIHLPTLLEEIATLKKAGIDILPRLHISHAAHILFDFHKEVDAVLEARRSGEGIGTTKRGIGPAYMEKAERSGIRMEHLGADVKEDLQRRAKDLKPLNVTIDVVKELSHMTEAVQILGDRINDITFLLHNWIAEEQTILIEGAQGSLLDIDHGTYPFVTSSSTTTAGALQGLGLPPQVLTSCIGVAKAYCTRVGSGPFPMEADEQAAERLRKRGGEYGSTTGRPRRCGWLSLTDLQRVAAINGVTHWNITKLDVLDEEEHILVGVGEEEDGTLQVEGLPGWQESTEGMKKFNALPEHAQGYIQFIEEQTGIPASFIGTGPDRTAMILQ